MNASKELIEIFEQKIRARIAKVWGQERGEEQPLPMAAEAGVAYENV